MSDRFPLIRLTVSTDSENQDLVMCKFASLISWASVFQYTVMPQIMDWVVENNIYSHTGIEKLHSFTNDQGELNTDYMLSLVVDDPAQAVFLKTRWSPIPVGSAACT